MEYYIYFKDFSIYVNYIGIIKKEIMYRNIFEVHERYAIDNSYNIFFITYNLN